MKKILITSALPYANGPIHFGHIAGAYLPGDCYARFERMQGNDVLYLCGSDEYGVAITLSAELAKRTPQEHVEIFHKINQEFFKQLEFSFDHYSRTTWPGHVPTVQQFFLDLYHNGYIEKKVENHLYSPEEKRFLADRYVIGMCPKCGFPDARGDECPKCGASFEAKDVKNPKSKLTGSPLELRPSSHWYIKFDQFKEKLAAWIKTKDWKPNVLKFAENYINDLKPRGITRDSEWGIDVPLEEAKDKVLYVWFDAPIGYISAAKEWAEKRKTPEAWKSYWLDPQTKLVHFIGKDNIPFHTVFFPAMIMGQNTSYKLPDEVPANEFFLLEGRQFSKSEGWYIDLEAFFKKYTPDQIRYYLAANAPETSDTEFTWKDFQTKCNGDLLGKLGNFVNRTLVFIKNNLSSQIPALGKCKKEDEEFLKKMKDSVNEAKEAYAHFQLRRATQVIMELAALANTYFDYKKPWVLIKDPSKKKEIETFFAICLETIKNLALIASPIIPKTAQEIWELLGFTSLLEKQNWEEVVTRPLSTHHHLPEPKILFRKIEDEEIEKEIQKLHKKAIKETVLDKPVIVDKNTIEFSDFEKLDLRVGQILQAEAVEKSKKLLKLKVDLGTEVRQIVAGIALTYKPEQLIGKKVAILANIKPIKIMGLESFGMLLVGGEEILELPTFQTLMPGSKIC